MTALRVILPVFLGVLAAILNFVVLRGNTAPLELIVLRTDVKADSELTEDMLERLSVRADKEVFKSAAPFSERGLLLGRRVTRSINAGEILLYADLHNLDEENIRLYLKPGETTLTIPVKASRVAPGLRRGDSVGVLVGARAAMTAMKTMMPASSTASSRILGPFRLLSLGTAVSDRRETRLLVVAIKPGADGRVDASVTALQDAIAADLSSGGRDQNGVRSVEYYLPSK
jgi:Flp pilus assembly protein CpaB